MPHGPLPSAAGTLRPPAGGFVIGGELSFSPSHATADAGTRCHLQHIAAARTTPFPGPVYPCEQTTTTLPAFLATRSKLWSADLLVGGLAASSPPEQSRVHLCPLHTPWQSKRRTAWVGRPTLQPVNHPGQEASATNSLTRVAKSAGLERFHNSHALSGIEQGGIFLRKMPLDSGGFGVQQLWNRCSFAHTHHKGKNAAPRELPDEAPGGWPHRRWLRFVRCERYLRDLHT